MPTFRTDDWPIPEGMSYSAEVKQQCREKLGRLKAEGEKQALDRKIRQMQIDLPRLEHALHLQKNRSTKKFVQSKIARMEAILDELQKDDSLTRGIRRYPGLVETLRAAREAVEAARAESEGIE